jgi:hypothetical protein
MREHGKQCFGQRWRQIPRELAIALDRFRLTLPNRVRVEPSLKQSPSEASGRGAAGTGEGLFSSSMRARMAFDASACFRTRRGRRLFLASAIATDVEADSGSAAGWSL